MHANFAPRQESIVRKCKLIVCAIVARTWFMGNGADLTRVHLALQESSTHHVVSNSTSVHRRFIAHLGVDYFYHCLLQCWRHLS